MKTIEEVKLPKELTLSEAEKTFLKNLGEQRRDKIANTYDPMSICIKTKGGIWRQLSALS